MPQINLLSPTLGKRIKKDKHEVTPELNIERPSVMIYYPLGGIIVLMVVIWIIMGIRISRYNHKLTKLKKMETNLAVEPQKLIKLNEKKNILLKRLSFLEELTKKRFLWSEKLDRISNLIPDGVWLTEISSEKKIILDSITGEPQGEQSLISIKGRAVASRIQDAIELVGIFHEKLKNDKIFSQDFLDIKLNSVTKGTIAHRDVMNFEFDCIIK
jgi:Tfp pilus assembly protein PilN